MTTTEPLRHAQRAPRTWRVIRIALLCLAAIVVVAVVGFLVWANTGVMQAERGPLAAVRADPAISVVDHGNDVVMAPTGGASGTGLVFIPGAKVDPNAYLYKLSGVVKKTGLTVVITKPILNLAFFDPRPLTAFTNDTHGITAWYVGGHSLGGVRACQYAAQPDVHGLILFGSYCANDLAHDRLQVLSLSGSEDGLSTPHKVRQAAHLLPPNTTFHQIDGANHARFGDYGIQPGDGTATISSQAVQKIITREIAQFLL